MVIGILGFLKKNLFVNEGATNFHCLYAFGLPVFKFAKHPLHNFVQHPQIQVLC
jgi:hypothetical protein